MVPPGLTKTVGAKTPDVVPKTAFKVMDVAVAFPAVKVEGVLEPEETLIVLNPWKDRLAVLMITAP